MSDFATPDERRTYPSDPAELKASTTESLAHYYVHLDDIKEAGQAKVGRSDSPQTRAVEADVMVREVINAGLSVIVREMAAVQSELNSRQIGGLLAALQSIGES